MQMLAIQTICMYTSSLAETRELMPAISTYPGTKDCEGNCAHECCTPLLRMMRSLVQARDDGLGKAAGERCRELCILVN